MHECRNLRGHRPAPGRFPARSLLRRECPHRWGCGNGSRSRGIGPAFPEGSPGRADDVRWDRETRTRAALPRRLPCWASALRRDARIGEIGRRRRSSRNRPSWGDSDRWRRARGISPRSGGTLLPCPPGPPDNGFCARWGRGIRSWNHRFCQAVVAYHDRTLPLQSRQSVCREKPSLTAPRHVRH